MATYLLKADDDEMARWKAHADREGTTFARFVRAALDGACGETLELGLVREGQPPFVAVDPSDHFKPDPKPSQRRR